MTPSLSLGPSAAAVPVDIPDSWDPRTKQQPTGLVACPASPMDFSDCKYDHQAFDFQDEAIWDVIWLADK